MSEAKEPVNQPEGNYYDKYNTKNPIARKMMKGYFDALDSLLNVIRDDVHSVLEAGCGEGEVSFHVYDYFAGSVKQEAFDISEKVIEGALKRNPGIDFFSGNIYEVDRGGDHELVLCCEVLEHMEEPEKVIERLLMHTSKYLIVSVPHEPVWRILNMARGKYLRDLGNTPGHIQHWTSAGFRKMFVGYDCRIVAVRKPLPWTMLLIEKN